MFVLCLFANWNGTSSDVGPVQMNIMHFSFALKVKSYLGKSLLFLFPVTTFTLLYLPSRSASHPAMGLLITCCVWCRPIATFAFLSFCHIIYHHFSLFSTLGLPRPLPLILLVLPSGIISSQLQEDPTSCAPKSHHQASYLCDSPEQHRVHPGCLPRGQAFAGGPVDHG